MSYLARTLTGVIETSPETVTLAREEFDLLLAVATLYMDAFAPGELLTLPGKLLLQDMEGILDRYGRRC